MNGKGVVLMSTRTMDRRFAAPERDIDYVLDRREAFSTLLDAIPVRLREAVRLFYFSDIPVEGIAARLGTTVARARELLADAEALMRNAAKVHFPHLCANGNGK